MSTSATCRPLADHGPRTTDHGRRRGFTLIELLVVIFIILLVSAVALPTVLPALNHRQVSEAGRILQGMLVGARDQAIHDGQPSGIRLLPDPAFPITWITNVGGQPQINPSTILAYNRVIPISPAPEYTEGMVSIYLPSPTNNYASITGGQIPYLVLEQSPVNPQQNNAPNPPTSWFWNIRVGDKIQINNSGPWYTVVGPSAVGPSGGNDEWFVNVGAAGTTSGWTRNGYSVDYLFLVNGRDDGGMFNSNLNTYPPFPDGWVDSGFDGIDNNGINGADEAAEWEQETWLGGSATGVVNVPYTIRRRPAPLPAAREVALPTSMVIDATTWNNGQNRERSRLPVDGYSGVVDILINPDGTVQYTTPYATPASFGMDQAFYHFWLAERQDLAAVDTTQNSTPYLPTPTGVTPGRFADGAEIKGNYSIVTLSARTGQITVSENPGFFYNLTHGYNGQVGTYNPNNPFIPAEQGIRGGP